jgi:copper chaperone CopZ
VVRALEELEGVVSAKASFQEKNAAVVHDPGLVTPDQMCQALLKAGFVARSASG